MEKLKAIGPVRIIMSFAGVFICAVSIGMFKFAALGVDPFQTLMAGLDYVVPISFGTLYVIVNAVLLLFALFTEKHYIGYKPAFPWLYSQIYSGSAHRSYCPAFSLDKDRFSGCGHCFYLSFPFLVYDRRPWRFNI